MIVSKDKGNEKEKEGSIDASYSYNGATIKQPGLRRQDQDSDQKENAYYYNSGIIAGEKI